MLLIYGAESSWTPEERETCMVDSMKVCDQLAVEGKYIASSPLHSVSTATCLRIRDGKKQITDGPFAETTEQLGGYYVVEAENLDEALEIASRLPPAKVGTVEIRPLYPLPEVAQEPKGKVLRLSRLLPVAREKLYRCWTEPELLKQWFTPKPWQTVDCTLDLRPGGEFTTVMRSPEGQEFPSVGIVVDFEPNRKLHFTDAFMPGWIPSDKAFFTGIVTFADEKGGTRYIAEAHHWTVEDARQHEKMGFYEGWGKAADQLFEVASLL